MLLDLRSLRAEVMRGEGYHDIKPLGGVADFGQDAVQDRFYRRKGRVGSSFNLLLRTISLGNSGKL